MEQQTESQPLSGVRVVDLTHGVAGPYCTKLLADFGADVIKVERPGSGDYARSLGPFPDDVPHSEKSGLFLYLNTSKRGITLDMKSTDGLETLRRLVKDADILVESYKPGVMERLGLGYEALKEINPDLIMTSVSNFGQTGPYRDYEASDIVFYAMGGNMTRLGLPDRYPLQLVDNHVQYLAGNVSAMSTLFAWYARNYRGMGGQQVDISIFETAVGSINGSMSSLVGYQYTGERPIRMSQGGMVGLPGNGYFPCLDGYIGISAGFARWPNVVAMLGMPELLDDPRFNTPQAQSDPERREEFESTIWLPWVLERTKEQVVEECQANEIICGLINTIEEAMDHNPQADARGYFVEADHSMVGKLRYPGAPIHSPRGWWQLRNPAPLLGEHTQEVLKEGWRTTDGGSQRSSVRSSQANTRLPLEGIRVLDITLALAGPYGSMFLADMGAEVIRLEPRSFIPLGGRGQSAHPDPEQEKKALTSVFPNRDPGERPWNRSSGFNTMARNKRSITVELATPEGRDVVRRLAEVSDLFVQNSVPGAMDRLGIGYETLRQWNPRLSMIAISGPGQTGPWRGYRGWGYIFESLYGYGSIIGYPDMDTDGVPVSVPSDPTTGVTAVMASIMALHWREQTGKGSFIDTTLGETFASTMSEHYMDYQMNHRIPGRLGNRHRLWVQGAYPCAGDDEWIAISMGKIEQWHAICRLMGRPELIEEEWSADIQRLQNNHDQVDQIIGDWTKDQDNYALFHRLQEVGVPGGPVMHPPLAYADPQLKEREFFVPITVPEVGTHLYPGTVFKMSKIPFEVMRPPVRLGEDNDYVYREVLKLTEEEYDHLKAQGHIGMDYLPHVK